MIKLMPIKDQFFAPVSLQRKERHKKNDDRERARINAVDQSCADDRNRRKSQKMLHQIDGRKLCPGEAGAATPDADRTH